MSDYLTRLPVELIYKILENVPLIDILSSVCLVNKRLRSISLICPRSQLDFSCVNTSMDKSQFDSICTQMLYSTSQVVSLTLFDENDLMMTRVKNYLFFSRFNIIHKTFRNLRSLTLTSIKYETWRLLKTQLPSLITALSICFYLSGSYSDQFSYVADASDIFNGLLFLSPLLQRLSVKMTNVLENNLQIRPPNLSISSCIQYLHIKSVRIDLLSLLVVAPMLHTLKCRFQTRNLPLGRVYPRLLYLQQLHIEVQTITWKKMARLLSSFPRLVDLVVIADDVNSDMADGFEWARILQRIKYFEFKFEFSYHALRKEPLNLHSFRTNFWIKEKKWFVTYDRSTNAHDSSILYSNSSSIIVDPPHEINGTIISESTASELSSFSHVHCLTICDQYLKYPFLHRYNHVKKLYLPQVTTTSLKPFNELVTCLDTSQIMTCNIVSKWNSKSSFEYIDFLRNLPRLRRLEVSGVNLSSLFLHQWPHIVDLQIEKYFDNMSHVLSSNDIDALCHSFRHVKRLDIHSSSVTDLPQLLNQMKMILTDIIIRQRHVLNNEQFITCEWIEQNTELKNFHYTSISDFWNSVKLWL
jgi:hypothetical protein